MFMLAFAVGFTVFVVLLVVREIRGLELLEERVGAEGVNRKELERRSGEIES